MEERVNPDEVKVVCGWCKSHLSGRPDAKRVSHGICPACFDEQMKNITIISKEDKGEKRTLPPDRPA